jgi:hypothetical protein
VSTLAAVSSTALAQPEAEPGPGVDTTIPDDQQNMADPDHPEPIAERPERPRRSRGGPMGRDIDILWFGVEGGYSYVNLKMISYDNLLPEEIDVKESGPAFGAAAGIKLKIITAGLHLSVGNYGDFDVWSINLDGQIHIPLGFIEPYFRFGIGYAFLGSFRGQVNMDGVDVDGFDVLGGFGIDIYPSHFFSFGAGMDVTILNLTRTDSITDIDLTQDGAAVGMSMSVQAKATLHF